MKRFRFRLEQVLHVRHVQEDMAKAELMGANRAAHGAAVRVEDRLADYRTRSLPAGAVPHADFEKALFLLDTAAGAVDVARVAQRDALVVVDERRSDWIAARRRVAALEQLESRRRAEHEIVMRRAEDKLVDDLVVARHGAKLRARTKTKGSNS